MLAALPPLATYLGLAAVVVALLVLVTGILSPKRPSRKYGRRWRGCRRENTGLSTIWMMVHQLRSA